eukprot:scaffold449_cov184-Amphora_coffeaeformis.AAC.12
MVLDRDNISGGDTIVCESIYIWYISCDLLLLLLLLTPGIEKTCSHPTPSSPSSFSCCCERVVIIKRRYQQQQQQQPKPLLAQLIRKGKKHCRQICNTTMMEPNVLWNALNHSHQKWNELDGQAREAASVLGYTPEEWNAGRVTHLFLNKSWTDLNPPQQDAARLLGMTEEKWSQVATNVHKNHPRGLHEEEQGAETPAILPSPFDTAA